VKRPWRIIALVAALAIVAAAGLVAVFADDFIERRVRDETLELLHERFQSEVELGSVDVRLVPTLGVTFERLVLRHRGRRDIPPLISIRTLAMEGTLWELWARRLDRIHIDGLDLVIPPRRGADMPRVSGDRPDDGAGDGDGGPDVLIRELVTENARLSIMPKQAGKRTREFQIFHLRMESLNFTRPTPFEADLTNPKPEGRIRTTGTFGPWEADEPSLTPVSGAYTFDADLGTIKGLGGTLDAEGGYAGPLERIETRGTTKTPDFRLTSLDGHALPLSTRYHAIVDGTNGDVILERVEARLGGSTFLTKGSIVDVKGVKGRRILLEAKTTDARMTDVLRLTLKGDSPPLVGRLAFDSSIDLPPGEPDVIDRLVMTGAFRIEAARFTGETVQEKIDELARRGQGRPQDRAVDDVRSDMRGRFRLRDAVLRIEGLAFEVEGAAIALGGIYNLRSEALDFRGDVRLRAPVSRTVTGFRSLLLKPFDPLLRKRGAGTRLAIRVTGTRDKPDFGVEIGRTLKGK
jgi:hypothetical protein